MGVSTLFFLVSLFRISRWRYTKTAALSFVTLIAVFIIATLVYLISDYFTGEGVNDAVIYHLYYGFDGAGMESYYPIIIATFGILLILIYTFFYLYKKLTKQNKAPLSTSAVGFLSVALFSAFITHPLAASIYEMKIREADSAGFEKNYRTPTILSSPQKKMNFVYIYAESVERTYFDKELFGDLLKELRGIEEGATTFTNIRQTNGAGWTIAGLTSSSCAIPLVTPSDGNSMSNGDFFYPKATCVGDLLKDEGYFLSFMGGASLEFAGKGKFFKTHGFDEVLGREELLPQLKDKEYLSSWGIYDDTLLDMAYKKFEQLSRGDSPFGLTLLTLDTHHPYGHIPKSCEDVKFGDGKDSMLNSLACTDMLISDFVKKIQTSKYGKDTIIAIGSDHLAMHTSTLETLQRGDRRNMFMILDPRREGQKIDNVGSTLDIAPTFLSSLGFGVRMGLGRDLFREESLIGANIDFNKKLKSWEESIAGFWGFPQIQNDIRIDLAAKRVEIEDKSYSLPILVELDNKLQSKLYFSSDFDDALCTIPKLETYLSQNNKNSRSIHYWIDSCKNIKKGKFEDDSYCIATIVGKQMEIKVLEGESELLRIGNIQTLAREIGYEISQDRLSHIKVDETLLYANSRG